MCPHRTPSDSKSRIYRSSRWRTSPTFCAHVKTPPSICRATTVFSQSISTKARTQLRSYNAWERFRGWRMPSTPTRCRQRSVHRVSWFEPQRLLPTTRVVLSGRANMEPSAEQSQGAVEMSLPRMSQVDHRHHERPIWDVPLRRWEIGLVEALEAKRQHGIIFNMVC